MHGHYLIATLQLTGGGSASFKFLPGIGTHSYKAVFAGTSTYAASSSNAVSLTVTGPVSATNAAPTTIASSGSAGNYALTATVTGSANAPPTGAVSFLDVDNGNYLLGKANLGVSSTGYSLVTSGRYPTTSGPGATVTADFNGDGLPDVAATSYDRSGARVAGAITILLGQAGGTFVSSSTTTPGVFPASLVTADFNGDGAPDLMTGGLDGTVNVLLGVGDGTFRPGTNVASGLNVDVFGLVAGDFNGDGIEDVAGATTDTNTVFVLLGHGDGTFTKKTFSSFFLTDPAPVAALLRAFVRF